MSFEDKDGFQTALNDIQELDWHGIVRKSLRQMYNRGKQGGVGGTPVRTGELRQSMGYSGDEIGYTKEYAPWVEFGHRTKSGKFVTGRAFLKANMDRQQKILVADVRKHIQKLSKD